MKDIKCKCSHVKSEHNKFLGDPTSCKVCGCDKYVKFNRPDKFDKLSVIIGFFVIAICIIIPTLLYIEINSVPEEKLNEPFEITLGQYLDNIFVLAIVCFLFLGYVFYDISIRDYFINRGRKTF